MQRGWTPATAVNFRDLGGLPIAGGGHIRSGLVFRSGSPQFLSVGDARRLVRETGIRLVLDLRYAHESAAEGHGPMADSGARLLNVPVVGAGGAHVEMKVLAGHSDHLGGHYISYVQRNAGALATALGALAEPGGLPALVHCAAGKDRTGVLVAVLLAALDVPDHAIVRDYAETAANLPDIMANLRTAPSYAATIGLRPLDDPFAQSPPETMQRFLDWLAAEYGSARDMLLGAGLDAVALDTLHDRLVDRAAA